MLLQTPVLARVPVAVHGFTTRDGGISQGALTSLNLALRGDETPAALVENWRRVAGALDRSWDASRVAVLQQVHGSAVVEVVRPGGPLAPVAEADGAWTRVPGVILAVRVADCVPILMAAPGGVAVVHAGWRGAAAGIIGVAVERLCAGTGCEPGQLAAAIGPAISQSCFEVGPEVVTALADTGVDPEEFAVSGPRGRPLVDLHAVVRAHLRRERVGSVDGIQACTTSDPRFYSHRRDGDRTGRQAGVIAWCPR